MSSSSFPFKLYDVLEAAEYSQAISWLPNGRSFTLYDDDMFVETVLPKFSKATKLRSFHRQLNLWGFNRNRGEDSSTWHHPLFIRGRPELLSNIIRVSKSSLRADTTFEVGQSSQESNLNRVDHNHDKDKRQYQSGRDDDGVIKTAATRTNDFPYNREEAAMSLSIQAGSSTSSQANIDRGQSHQYQSQHNAVNDSFLNINHAYESSTVGTITSLQPQPQPTESIVGTDSSAILPGGQTRAQYPSLQDRQGNPPIEEGDSPDDEFSAFIGKNIHPT